MSTSNQLSIIIVGGGIVGLTTAVALRGAGRRIQVLEQSRMNKEVGACISLQPNASKIATRFGLDEFLQTKKPMVDRAFRILNAAGRLERTIPLTTEKYGADRMLYHRADLHDALKAAALSDALPGLPVEIRTASRVVKCDCEAGLVTLESGEELRGDLVIGADGIHSVLRKFVVGEGYNPRPTGIAAYRILVPSSQLRGNPAIASIMDPHDAVTTMVVGHDRRIIMGPGRGGEVFSAIVLVPDEAVETNISTRSWTSPASRQQLLQSVKPFAESVQQIFGDVPEDIALWQLRDIDPLDTWVKGRTILVGDAAHAMLPTQGQGASQGFEDAEALQAFFDDIAAEPSLNEVHKRLVEVFETRYQRASLIQNYSRLAGKSGTDGKDGRVTLDPAQFMDYNCLYEGAKAWRLGQREKQLTAAFEKLGMNGKDSESPQRLEHELVKTVKQTAAA